jgi:hypothetical protein
VIIDQKNAGWGCPAIHDKQQEHRKGGAGGNPYRDEGSPGEGEKWITQIIQKR